VREVLGEMASTQNILVINDEAHRSIYGDAREVVQFFQATRIGLVPESPKRASPGAKGFTTTRTPRSRALPARGPSSPNTSQSSQSGSIARTLSSNSYRLVSAPPN
jgi:hypothetical protein